MATCILCGTEIDDDYCIECDMTANDMGYDYNEIIGGF